MNFNYPFWVARDDNDTLMVTFQDVPGATFGRDGADARERARVALQGALQRLIDDKLDIPIASAANGRETVRPTLLGALKLTLYQAMRQRGWRKADLARAIGANPRQVDRLFDLEHGSTVYQLEYAIAACGTGVAVLPVPLAA